jgi:hypothetical protein
MQGKPPGPARGWQPCRRQSRGSVPAAVSVRQQSGPSARS